MRIVEQIINIITKWFHVFIQDRGTYKHRIARFVSLYIYFYGKNTKDSHLSTLTFVFVSSGDVVYKERWWHIHKLSTDLF
jgi:hypothetical protein